MGSDPNIRVGSVALAEVGAPAEAAELHAALLAAECDMGQVIVVRDGTHRVYMNDAAAHVSGYSLDELHAMRSLHDIVVSEQQPRVRAESDILGRHEMTIVRKDGRLVDLEVHRRAFMWRGKEHILSVARDVTDRNRAERERERQALYDPLTELPNRALFRELAGRAIATARRDGSSLALVHLDLDRFREVNASLGHAAGDEILVEFGRRLGRLVRSSDAVARLAGDSFAVVLPGVAREAATKLARKLLEACDHEFAVGDRAVVAGASAGIALYPEHGDTASDLERTAEVAMYAAKRAGSGLAVYEPDEHRESAVHIGLAAELRQAVRQHRLVVHYQPLVSLTSGLILGAEALVRWEHPSRGLLPPEAFVPLAERSGIMPALTYEVLTMALRQYGAWHAAGHALPVLVNVSARELRDPGFVETIEGLRDEHRLSPKWLKLEITEAVVVDDPERVIATLKRLRELGILIALDDFGTGFSSLSYLARLPVDAIKIDRSFILAMRDDARVRSIVRATIELAHSLGFGVVAEGVENATTLGILTGMSCDMAQGFHIARPMPADTFDAWLPGAAWKPRPVPAPDAIAATATSKAPSAALPQAFIAAK